MESGTGSDRLAESDGTRNEGSKDPTPDSQGPTPAVKEQLQHLSQVFDVWQADFRLTPHWIKIGGEPVRPWIVLITSRSDDLVLAHEIIDEPPSSDLLWDVLAKAMSKPAVGEPHRPTELQVRSDERWDELKPHLDETRDHRRTDRGTGPSGRCVQGYGPAPRR